ncbi:MAG: hypothetical protein KBF48_04715, partial [Xanthomonadales bacterium]|nr:hypothetical protein [Xanthomonadales bacterium]
SYAQQRYYDPQLGVFYSPDPMAVDTHSAINFNRYAYANNSPYRFVDPDGRSAIVTEKKDRSVLIQYPTNFVGPEATAQNIGAVKQHVAGMSGTYQVNGKQTVVQVEVTEVNKKFLGGTPRAARNEVKLLSGPTSGDSGRSWAELGGKKAEIDVTDRLVPNGVAPHEFGHLGGVDDQYDKATGKSDPSNGNGIMNRVPGVVDSPTIEGIVNAKSNIHREER